MSFVMLLSRLCLWWSFDYTAWIVSGDTIDSTLALCDNTSSTLFSQYKSPKKSFAFSNKCSQVVCPRHRRTAAPFHHLLHQSLAIWHFLWLCMVQDSDANGFHKRTWPCATIHKLTLLVLSQSHLRWLLPWTIFRHTFFQEWVHKWNCVLSHQRKLVR